MEDGHIISYGMAKTVEFFMLFGLLFGAGFYQLWQLKKLERQRQQARAEAAARGEPEPVVPIPGWMTRR